MRKVLVTGGSGYIGAHLCLHLANQGYAVTPLCHSKVPDDNSWMSKMDQVIVGDVRNEEFLEELAQNNFEVLIHLVSFDHHQSNQSPSLVTAVNITPVWSLLKIFSNHSLKKFIYFSTAQVYGHLHNELVAEYRQLNPKNPYGLTHQMGEVVCDYFNRNSLVECRILRLSNSYGAPIFNENNCWWLVVNDLCKMAYFQKAIVLQSDGTPLRDFIHSLDVCLGVQMVIETEEKHNIYNLSSGTTLSVMEIAEKIKSVYASRYDHDLVIKAKKVSNNVKNSRYEIDNSLIESIGFKPQMSLEEGINGIFNYFEQKYQ